MAEVKYHKITITNSRNQYCLSCEIELGSQEDYIQCVILDDLTFTFDGQIYTFFIENKQRNRGHGKAEYTITGLSKSALLDAPYSEPISDEFSGMASDIVASLAPDYNIDWRTIDWYIPANTLMPADQTPLSIIKDIVKTVGAVIQTSPDGTIVVEAEYPLRVIDWIDATVDYTLSDTIDLTIINEAYEHKPGYNRYLVSDQETSPETIRIEEEALTTTTKHLRVYQTPWEDDFTFRHTGGDWVVIEPLGIEERLIEDEIVEFVNGAGSLQYPIYERTEVEWLQENLGSIDFLEHGQLESDIDEESLLQISYRTRCRLYLITDTRSEQVQMIVEGEE